MLVPCRYPIIRIRCKVRFDGSILKSPSYPKAAPVSIVTEIRTGKSPRTHGTLMGFAPLAASAVSAISAGRKGREAH